MNEQNEMPLIALVGNPNSGKSSIFNHLTGLRQRVGNFPGVTVDKKIGVFSFENGQKAQIIDFPGTYSFYPTAQDGKVVVQILSNPEDQTFPDLFVYVADVTQLERHLLFFSQIKELNRPVILVLNMIDLAEESGVSYNKKLLSVQLQCPVLEMNARSKEGVDELIVSIKNELKNIGLSVYKNGYQYPPISQVTINTLSTNFPKYNPYQRLLLAHHYEWLNHLSPNERNEIAQVIEKTGFITLQEQMNEVMQRYDTMQPILKESLIRIQKGYTWTDRIDKVVTHWLMGPILFFLLMFLIFQAIFDWSSYPMDFIESIFTNLSLVIEKNLPDTWFTHLITEGIIAGLGGILIFIPQIALLFFLISILEEVGYMARAVFIFDRIMQKFGMNGRSIVSLISGGACAIPAVMSTRTINNWKEKLITIMVTPLISCSARIPVYTTLIGLAFPMKKIWGFASIQAVAFMSLYLLSIVSALLAALVFKKIIKSNEPSYLLLELPEYRPPLFKNVWLTVWEKVKAFTIEAGKIILLISVVLWFLASYGPGNKMELATKMAEKEAITANYDENQTNNLIASKRIESSYAGQLGKFIEPAIAPLGFDWKIGIALITSFAAREVFVGTMATIYAIGSDDDNIVGIKGKMAAEINPTTQKPVYNFATSVSLLLFYVFALQCMSTIAVVKKETNSWKWAIIQFLFMGAMAYFSSWLAFTILS